MENTDADTVRHRVRFANLFVAFCAPLWVPCLVLGTIFFTNDSLYRLAVLDPRSGTSLVGDYRAAAGQLAGPDEFSCLVSRITALDGTDRRDRLLKAIGFADGSSGERELSVDRRSFSDIFDWVEGHDLFLLRYGTAVAVEHSAGIVPILHWLDHNIVPFCKEQEELRKQGLPELPPLRGVHAEARALILKAADSMEAKLAAYAEVRPWLLAFFYLWIAYSLFGFACAFYVILTVRAHPAVFRRAPAREPQQ